MKLIYLGKELDSEVEHELFAENEHGFKVTVTYREDSEVSKREGKKLVEIRNNVTEVHNLFNSSWPGGRRCAFESDIHYTGGHRGIDELESCIIELSEKKEEKFYEYPT